MFVRKKHSVNKKTDAAPHPLVAAVVAKGWRARGRVLRSKHSEYFWAEERSEARADRLEAALALAAMKATTHRGPQQRPLAVVSVPKLSARMQAHLEAFVTDHGPPRMAWAAVDDSGRVLLNTPDLGLDLAGSHVVRASSAPSRVDLFSDLNQWLLKVLLAHRFPKDQLAATSPERFRNASVLAAAADVSLPVVSRLLGQLKADGFLEHRHGHLELVRIADLLELWRMVAARGTRAEFHVRQKVVGKSMAAWFQNSRRLLGPTTRACEGLFDAAVHLDLKHVLNAPHCLWVDNDGAPVDEKLLSDLGLIPVKSTDPHDFTLRVPRFPEALFRAAIWKPDPDLDGWVDHFTDVIQTWMDVSHHPTRGRELADRMWSDLIVPCIGEA